MHLWGREKRSGMIGNRARGWSTAVAYDRWGQRWRVLRPARQHLAVSPRAGPARNTDLKPPTSSSLVEHVLGRAWRGLIPVELGGLLPQRRATCGTDQLQI